MSSFCGSWSAVTTTEEGIHVAVPLVCKSWSCPRCAAINRRKLLQRLQGTPAHTLLTLTCSPTRHANYDTAFKHMSACIPLLFKRLRRKYPQAELQYFLVWERTKKGWPHCHLVLRAPFIPRAWIKANWYELTGAYIIDIRALTDPDQLVRYVAKYLAKDPAAPPGYRRYRFSRHFLGPLLALPPGLHTARLHWHLEPLPPSVVGFSWSQGGYTCHQDVDGSVRAYPRGHPEEPLYDSFSLALARSQTAISPRTSSVS